MKHILSILFSISTFIVLAQTETEIIQSANELIQNKKYASAFGLLDKYDSTNTHPDILLLKEDIVLKYFVTSIMHQMFALKDLEKDEEIMDYRGMEGNYEIHFFQIDSLLENLISLYPNNCKLYKGLGDYYYEVYTKYGNNWLKDEAELINLYNSNLQKAVNGACADYFTYFVLGNSLVQDEKYNESKPYFLKSIEYNSEYPSSVYNLAYAYLFLDERENALIYAQKAFNLYKDSVYKSDAARMVGQIYYELKEDNKALEYFNKANFLDPNNFYTLKSILNLLVKNKQKESIEVTQNFLDLAPENPTIYNELENIYYSHQQADTLMNFYTSQLERFKGNKNVEANLNFYLGKIYLDKDKSTAKSYFLKAKKLFTTFLEKDHPVFEILDDALSQCTK